jgi:hypothetical protein
MPFSPDNCCCSKLFSVPCSQISSLYVLFLSSHLYQTTGHESLKKFHLPKNFSNGGVRIEVLFKYHPALRTLTPRWSFYGDFSTKISSTSLISIRATCITHLTLYLTCFLRLSSLLGTFFSETLSVFLP